MKDDVNPAKQGSEDIAFRATLRRERIIAREAMAAEEHALKAVTVLAHLEAFLSARDPSLLGFYWPIRAEVDCRPLVTKLLKSGWRACLPCIVDRHQAMKFREWTPESNMVEGEYSIPAVSDGPWVEPDVLLIPVNVFDQKGFRLGYGGGYYDRTLAAMIRRPLVVGIGFELARTDSIGPQAHDIAMNAVVTESGLTVFKR